MSEAPVRMEESSVKWEGRGKLNLVFGAPSREKSLSFAILLAPGGGGGMNIPLIYQTHLELARRGFLTVKFDFPYTRGLWSVLPLRVPREAILLSYRTIIEETRKRFNPTTLIIGGFSMGAYVASILAARDPELDIHALFFLGYPPHQPGRPKKISDAHLYAITKPMFFASGAWDPYARSERLEEVVSKLGAKARLHLVENGDHLLNPHRGKDEYLRALGHVSNMVAAWAASLSFR